MVRCWAEWLRRNLGARHVRSAAGKAHRAGRPERKKKTYLRLISFLGVDRSDVTLLVSISGAAARGAAARVCW